jgi:branched-chain amino acid transport system permease protein
VFGLILVLIIFLLPHGSRQIAYTVQGWVHKLRK